MPDLLRNHHYSLWFINPNGDIINKDNSSIKFKFALDQSGKLIGRKTIPPDHNNRPEYFCYYCKTIFNESIKMIGCYKENGKRRPYFRHFYERDEEKHTSRFHDNYVYLVHKKLLADKLETKPHYIDVTKHFPQCKDKSNHIHEMDIMKDCVEVYYEKEVSGDRRFRPDIRIIYENGLELALEIANTHSVDIESLDYYTKEKISVLEVNIKNLKESNQFICQLNDHEYKFKHLGPWVPVIRHKRECGWLVPFNNLQPKSNTTMSGCSLSHYNGIGYQELRFNYIFDQSSGEYAEFNAKILRTI